ncbi:sigma-70 family RNA polymerase sigma factor [bacterium]|nr:sigma-70 family RNA polymerase sigma factor [bacterium]
MNESAAQSAGAGAMEDRFSDEAIIRRCQAGDWSDYDRLVERHRRIVWAAIDAVIDNKSLIPDLVQESFIRAYRKMDTYQFMSSFSSWIFRLARNHAISYLRSKAAKLKSTSIDDDADDSVPISQRIAGGSEPAEEYERQDMRRSLDQILAQLPEHYRAVLNLYYLQELSYEEIAKIQDIPLNTVRTHLRRARQKLMELTGQGGWQ